MQHNTGKEENSMRAAYDFKKRADKAGTPMENISRRTAYAVHEILKIIEEAAGNGEYLCLVRMDRYGLTREMRQCTLDYLSFGLGFSVYHLDTGNRAYHVSWASAEPMRAGDSRVFYSKYPGYAFIIEQELNRMEKEEAEC